MIESSRSTIAGGGGSFKRCDTAASAQITGLDVSGGFPRGRETPSYPIMTGGTPQRAAANRSFRLTAHGYGRRGFLRIAAGARLPDANHRPAMNPSTADARQIIHAGDCDGSHRGQGRSLRTATARRAPALGGWLTPQ